VTTPLPDALADISTGAGTAVGVGVGVGDGGVDVGGGTIVTVAAFLPLDVL
jgi:hypothetical protein